MPRELNTYESRPSEQLPRLSWAGFSDNSFQDGTEAALGDQIPMAQYFKKAYNLMKIRYQELVSFPMIERDPDTYYRYGSVCLFDDYLVYPMEKLETKKPELDRVIASFNRVAEENPDTQFYLYYVEHDHDIDFETGEKSGVYDYIRSILSIPEEQVDKYAIDSFEDYARAMYVTDHHWNWRGSYDGYKELLTLLGCGDEPLEPLEEVTFPRAWRGSKANAVGYDNKKELFTAYRFDFPPMTVRIDGEAAADYGHQDEFFAQPDAVISYGNFYGDNYGEVVIHTGNSDKENLLIIGDSFTHGILKLLASHYGTTVLLDQREYEVTDQCVAQHISAYDIDKVLFVGYYLTLTDLRLEIGG